MITLKYYVEAAPPGDDAIRYPKFLKANK